MHITSNDDNIKDIKYPNIPFDIKMDSTDGTTQVLKYNKNKELQLDITRDSTNQTKQSLIPVDDVVTK